MTRLLFTVATAYCLSSGVARASTQEEFFNDTAIHEVTWR
jgi:hypothetical protein